MRKIKRPISIITKISLIMGAVLITSCSDKGVDPNEEPLPTIVSFASNVQPIFNSNCAGCHVGGNQGGLSLDTYTSAMQGGNSGVIIVAGDADNSLLVQRLEGTVTPQMPFGQNPLSSAQIQLIRDWIDQGAENN